MAPLSDTLEVARVISPTSLRTNMLLKLDRNVDLNLRTKRYFDCRSRTSDLRPIARISKPWPAAPFLTLNLGSSTFACLSAKLPLYLMMLRIGHRDWRMIDSAVSHEALLWFKGQPPSERFQDRNGYPWSKAPKIVAKAATSSVHITTPGFAQFVEDLFRTFVAYLHLSLSKGTGQYGIRFFLSGGSKPRHLFPNSSASWRFRTTNWRCFTRYVSSGGPPWEIFEHRRLPGQSFANPKRCPYDLSQLKVVANHASMGPKQKSDSLCCMNWA
mmetsp:Transcript_67486/g.188310  ORF Transcript_67486/g.188310 Transcript_67486/m.188310 type:complete len:271 (+) Transcript_67486:26-838(+)